ncbi:MAG: Ig-like domain-containing protein [Candidatus Gastranaerophilales bacterium]|nr:Ig-like domain-containing protein [Candidatus Gastranaerophilales bacterium]
MRRKKQIVALSLAVTLVLGGVVQPSSPLSRVYAEEVQTVASSETPIDEELVSSEESATDETIVTDETTEPSDVTTDDGTAASDTDAAAPAEETEGDGGTLPATEEVIAPTAEGAEQPEETKSVSGNEAGAPVDVPGNTGDAAADAGNKKITVQLDITGGLVTTETYMDGMVSVGTDMPYKAATVKLQDKDENDAGSAAGYVTNSDNPNASAGTGALIRFTPKYAGTIVVALQLGDTKTFKVDEVTSEGLNTVYSYENTTGKKLDLKFEEVAVEAGKTYYIYAQGTRARFYSLTYNYKAEADEPDKPDKPDKPDVPPIELVDGVLAFPTAEGGGRLATGGRGGEVYVVTNLNDKGEGSLRYGIETAPADGRIIVFNVGGTINLESTLSFKNHNNITIAGQTAPGDGITIAGYDTDISESENIIIRFVRFRVGTANLLKGGDSMDALWGRDNKTFIIDHCTFSWNTDETLSTYRGQDGTVQWCLISESLTVSGHSKGRHGYGGIWGGDNTVFQYNLLANHTSRNPRVGGGFLGDPTAQTPPNVAKVQLNNNVLYNHGYFACYGGGYTYTNYIYNYVKPGRGTRDSLVNTLLGFGENGKVGGVYYTGNVLEGNAEVTADNSKGFSNDGKNDTTVATQPYTSEAFDHITLTTDTSYYDQVLNSAGATYPYRDAIDARVVAQVKTDTGSYINTQDEVGGYPMNTLTEHPAGFDTDGDGIPDEWESEHGLNPDDATDSRTLCLKDENDAATYGYAWIEVYFNELVDAQSQPDYVAENPTVTIDLLDNKLLDQGESIKVTATAESSKGIAKVEFYNGAVLVGTDTEAPYEWTYTPDAATGSIGADGTYHISVRAYDNAGNKTQSNTSRLYVNSTAGIGDWSQTDIGNPEVAGTASLVDGVLTVKGAGKIGSSEGSNKNVREELAKSTDDDFHFVYQELTGDAEIITRFDSYIPVDNHTFQGLMFRESLDDDAAMAALGFTMVKVDKDTIWSAFMVNRATKGGSVQNISETIDSPEAAAKAGIPLLANLPFKTGNDYLGTWLKLYRAGDTFTGYVSSDGESWDKVGVLTVEGMPETVYVGFAVEANRAGNDLINYNTSKFSNIEINTDVAKITYDVENVNLSGLETIAYGKDLTVSLGRMTGYVLPETVEVMIGGEPAVEGQDYTYTFDSRTGLISIPNVQNDISIRAYGTKRVVVPVEYEEIDENDLLTITEEADKLILTQTATSGTMQTTDKKSGVTTAASNVSYLLFPEVDEYHQLSMDVTVKSVTPIGKGDANGFFMGVFSEDDAPDHSGVYTTFAFRANMVGKGYWYKPGGTAGIYTGDGNPGITYELDTTYHVEFVDDGKGGFNANVTWDGGSMAKQLKVGESVIKPENYEPVRYGIAIIGATVEISNMKLVDPENNVIYEQKSETPEEKVNVEISPTISEASLTDAVKDKTGCSTVEELVTYLKNSVETKGYTSANSSVMEVTIKVSTDGGKTWEAATEATMPKEGVIVVLPYPTGTNKNDYDFVVSHLITQGWNGQTAGTVEWPTVTPTDEGLSMRVMSASPFTVAWKAKAAEQKPADNDNGGGSDDSSDDAAASATNVTTAAVKTGDHMNVSAVIWSIVLLAAVAGVGVLVYRKRKENGAENQ